MVKDCFIINESKQNSILIIYRICPIILEFSFELVCFKARVNGLALKIFFLCLECTFISSGKLLYALIK